MAWEETVTIKSIKPLTKSSILCKTIHHYLSLKVKTHTLKTRLFPLRTIKIKANSKTQTIKDNIIEELVDKALDVEVYKI